jgi:hypothetical protein
MVLAELVAVKARTSTTEMANNIVRFFILPSFMDLRWLSKSVDMTYVSVTVFLRLPID